MLKSLSLALVVGLCACTHTETVLVNHVAEHEQALQLTQDSAEHLQECRERFMMCGVETGGMICGVNLTDDGQVDCMVAGFPECLATCGQQAWIKVQACMIKIKNEPYCKDVR